MLENGKMGLLRWGFEVIFGHNVINRHFFRGIRRYFFNVIRGLRPANLDSRVRLCVTPVDDCRLVQVGRSMIEMLGVLAIIGVLSVGGIAGYSKAMEMWRVNKTVEEYKYVIHSLMEHLPELQKLNSSGSQYMLTDFILDANMVPSTWSRRGTDLSDSFGGATAIFIRRNHLSVEIYHHFPYESGASLSSVEFCKTMIKDIAQPLASAMYGVGLYLFDYDDDIIYGDAYCGSGKICLRNLTVSEINKICHSYKKGERYSSVILYF